MDEYGIEYTRYQTDRSALRKLIRKIYLRKAASMVSGPTLDFGCGIGELLSFLPPGSAGLEYNRDTVSYCRSRGLDVSWYDGNSDSWALGALPTGRKFQSMTISHVLEHLDAPAEILRALERESARSRSRKTECYGYENPVPARFGRRLKRVPIGIGNCGSREIEMASGLRVVGSSWRSYLSRRWSELSEQFSSNLRYLEFRNTHPTSGKDRSH